MAKDKINYEISKWNVKKSKKNVELQHIYCINLYFFLQMPIVILEAFRIFNVKIVLSAENPQQAHCF